MSNIEQMIKQIEADAVATREWVTAFRRLKPQTQQLIERDGLKCHWCGNTCDPTQSHDHDRYPSRDHLVKRADGGRDGLANLVLACRKCNTSRHGAWGPAKAISCQHPEARIMPLGAWRWCGRCGSIKHKNSPNWANPKEGA